MLQPLPLPQSLPLPLPLPLACADPDVTCGAAPLGPTEWPAPPSLGRLPNLLPLPGVSMRDAAFWRRSVSFVAAKLDLLSQGLPL